MNQTLVLATRNAGKVAELAHRLAPLGIALRSAADLHGAPDVDETAGTLQGNAALKARALARFSSLPALADDTGLEVDALDGAPGVRSARFAGEDASDADNRAFLLDRLAHTGARRARFRTVLVLADGAREHVFEGVCEGTIAVSERGVGGFGYDALFVPDEGDGRTFAEMTTDEKNRISHRGRALDAFVAWLGAQADVRP
jgi:XTP/dITP diphosphohydrolase